MSDTEEVEKPAKETTAKRLRRKSLEMDISELVRNKIIPTKSADLERDEKFVEEYDDEIANIEIIRSKARDELQNYQKLKINLEAYQRNELTLDLDDGDHRALDAFVKIHVSF